MRKLQDIVSFLRNQQYYKYVTNSLKKTQPEAEEKETLRKHTKRSLYSEILEKETIQNLSSITSITLEMDYVSWAKIELPNLKLENWDSCDMPTNLTPKTQDWAILKKAHSIREQIPKSDLYVLETNPFRRKLYFTGFSLRSMIIFFLSELNDGSLEKSKLLFQAPFIVNCLYCLTVGGERSSAKAIIENKILKDSLADQSNAQISDAFSLVDIKREQLCDFTQHVVEKQESLCLALLISLSFLDIIYLEIPESIKKLQKRAAYKSNKSNG